MKNIKIDFKESGWTINSDGVFPNCTFKNKVTMINAWLGRGFGIDYSYQGITYHNLVDLVNKVDNSDLIDVKTFFDEGLHYTLVENERLRKFYGTLWNLFNIHSLSAVVAYEKLEKRLKCH